MSTVFFEDGSGWMIATGQVIRVDSGAEHVMVDIGAEAGVRGGDLYEILNAEGEMIGTVEIVQVWPDSSVAAVLETRADSDLLNRHVKKTTEPALSR